MQPMGPEKRKEAQRTQETFDRMSAVVSSTECTGVAPAGLEEDELAALTEIAGLPRQSEASGKTNKTTSR